MFIDEAVVTLKSGDGGNGIATFRREKYVQFGGPNGGDGGNGGSILIKADPNINTLIDFKYRKKFKATNGESGQRSNMKGKEGEDKIIKVPVGTVIKDFEDGTLLVDMDKQNEVRLFLEGGKGGAGNTHFKTSTNRAPKIAKSGTKGIELKVKLELKLLADVALVGYPNVGKSSFINVVSAVESKVGNYHFTTLDPKLGVVNLGEGNSFVIADIPGLIEGAHSGVGLGDKFLKHIERCKMIYHIIDVSGIEGRDPIEDFKKINEELKNYSEKLSEKKQIVLANKMDLLPDDENYNKLKSFLDEIGVKVYPISAILKDGLKKVLYDSYEMMKDIKVEPLGKEKSAKELIKEKEEQKQNWIIEKTHDGYEVRGKKVKEVLDKYIFKNTDKDKVRFLQILRKQEFEDILREHGVKDGDMITIAGFRFEFVE
ncbi:MAG: GTPase ObgE [Fusobacteriota bacterium]